MKTIIVYYSLTGNTDYVAKKIKENLSADLLRLIPVKEYPDSGFKKFFWSGKSAVMKESPKLEKYEINLDKYDLVILGSPVWASNYTSPIRTFINSNKEILSKKEIAVFLCFSGGGADKTLLKLEKDLTRKNLNSLVLIDPKEKQKREKDDKINEFCNLLKNE